MLIGFAVILPPLRAGNCGPVLGGVPENSAQGRDRMGTARRPTVPAFQPYGPCPRPAAESVSCAAPRHRTHLAGRSARDSTFRALAITALSPTRKFAGPPSGGRFATFRRKRKRAPRRNLRPRPGLPSPRGAAILRGLRHAAESAGRDAIFPRQARTPGGSICTGCPSRWPKSYLGLTAILLVLFSLFPPHPSGFLRPDWPP